MEVSGSLVGDSPYLVMFEVDDTPLPGPPDGDLLAMPSAKVRAPHAAAACVTGPRRGAHRRQKASAAGGNGGA